MMRRPALLQLAIFMACSSLLASESPVWPVSGSAFPGRADFHKFGQPTASGKAESALFGCVRNDGSRFHEADDIAPVAPRRKGEATDPIVAIQDGVVAHVNRIAGNSSYGRYVVIEHSGASLPAYSLYAHLSRVEEGLATGTVVHAGDRLGIMGRSAGGYSIPKSNAHLHLEVGLRLSDSFQKWYDRQGFNSENHHGNFNGMNLIGWDPLSFYEAFSTGSAESILDYFNSIQPAVLLHVRQDRVPDFLKRYPQLALAGCEPEQRAGWEIILSAWGLPLSFRPLAADELKGVPNRGDVGVLAVDRNLLEAYSCRRIIAFDGEQVSLGRGAKPILELLFMLD